MLQQYKKRFCFIVAQKLVFLWSINLVASKFQTTVEADGRMLLEAFLVQPSVVEI